MKLPGLHHQIAMKRMAAGELARQARRLQCDPRTSYEMGVEAERLALEEDGLADQLHGNEQLMEGMLQQIHYLATSPQQSRYRSLCLTALEEAHSWLLRENGEPEPERKFEVEEAAAPKNGLKS